MQDQYRDLEMKFNTLQEFVTANVGVTEPSLVERPPTETAPPHNDSSALQDEPLPASQDEPLPASQDEPLPASQDEPLPASQDEGFQPVRNGARPT